jgi:hypothetical protein
MPPHSKPASRMSARLVSRKSGVSPREFEHLLERAEKYLSQRGKKLIRSVRSVRKTRAGAA